jgi:translation elongation factor EF-Tu-like GTPase
MIVLTCNLTLYSGTGRTTPILSGYRPLFNFPYASSKYSGRIDLTDGEQFFPGTTLVVDISFSEKYLDVRNLNVGTRFTFDEGTQPIGEGEILKTQSS